MPRLSLWRSDKTNDFKFLDEIIREQYTVGGLCIYIHKYLGVKTPANSTDATQPSYDVTDPLFMEDLLLLENRNRDYEEDVYTMRGVYRTQDIDFDLSQFGLFLTNDTIFVTFHYNDMIDNIGRKLMNGDVLEFPNLRDFHPLDDTVPKALPKFYVINDAQFASEGFSQTWFPHLWRVKAVPMVASQEYNDILNKFIDDGSCSIDGDDGNGNGSGTIGDYISQCSKNLSLNDSILDQAEIEVPLSGYDVSSFYIVQYDETGHPYNPTFSADSTNVTADNSNETVDSTSFSPHGTHAELGYLTGDGIPDNGYPVTPGVSFPPSPAIGDHVLRLDYSPNRLFRFNGSVWLKVEDNVRTSIYRDGDTQRSNLVNNDDTVSTSDRGDIPSKQSLNNLLRPKKDN